MSVFWNLRDVSFWNLRDVSFLEASSRGMIQNVGTFVESQECQFFGSFLQGDDTEYWHFLEASSRGMILFWSFDFPRKKNNRQYALKSLENFHFSLKSIEKFRSKNTVAKYRENLKTREFLKSPNPNNAKI